MDGLSNVLQTNNKLFSLVGFGSCCYVLIRLSLYILRAVRSYLLAPILNLGVNPAKLGAWGVVTGATDGIGT